MKAIIVDNNDEKLKHRTELTGNTIITIAISPKGITSNISGYVTNELLNALKKDIPSVIDELSKRYKKEKI